jgi:hypothetical protein
MTELWDPERLATVGWIMNRYSDFLRPGDLIRIGQEGDPCCTYRSTDDAPSARVENIEREVDGTVRFRAVMQGSNAVVNLDNRNVASDRIWEIHPSQVEEFRERVQNDRTHRGADGDGAGHTDSAVEKDAEEHEEVANELQDSMDDNLGKLFASHGLEKRVREMEFRGTEIEKTICGAIRELADDMMRMYHGEAPTFSIKFADKYDLALHTDVSYQGSHKQDADDRHDFSMDKDTVYDDERPSRSSSGDRHDFSMDVDERQTRSSSRRDRYNFDEDEVASLGYANGPIFADHTPDEP